MRGVINQMLRSIECRSNWAQKCAELLLHRKLRTTESFRGSGSLERAVKGTLLQLYMHSLLQPANPGLLTLGTPPLPLRIEESQ